MEQYLRNILLETLDDYYDSRLYNLHYMYKSYCENEEEERLYCYGMKMESQVDIVKNWIQSEGNSSELLLKAIRHLVKEVLDDFYKYVSNDFYFVDGFAEKSLRNIRTLRKDFLKYPKCILDILYEEEEFIQTETIGILVYDMMGTPWVSHRAPITVGFGI